MKNKAIKPVKMYGLIDMDTGFYWDIDERRQFVQEHKQEMMERWELARSLVRKWKIIPVLITPIKKKATNKR